MSVSHVDKLEFRNCIAPSSLSFSGNNLIVDEEMYEKDKLWSQYKSKIIEI